MNLRSQGLLLFLFIPLVLFLFVYHPFGILASFFPAILIMFGHRFVAEPFMERTLDKRCLFCGTSIEGKGDFEQVSIELKKGAAEFGACSAKHSENIRRFASFAISNKPILAAGIFIPLIYYLMAMLAVGCGMDIKIVDTETFIRINKIIFKGVIAVTVVLVSFLYTRSRKDPKGVFPFPIHNLALLGIGWTLWVFRIVGIVWIAQSIYTIADLAVL